MEHISSSFPLKLMHPMLVLNHHLALNEIFIDQSSFARRHGAYDNDLKEICRDALATFMIDAAIFP
jgi:hypothetical protein